MTGVLEQGEAQNVLRKMEGVLSEPTLQHPLKSSTTLPKQFTHIKETHTL
jgi:hypothetical protein